MKRFCHIAVNVNGERFDMKGDPKKVMPAFNAFLARVFKPATKVVSKSEGK